MSEKKKTSRRGKSDLFEVVVLPVRDLVLFPKSVSPLFIGRDSSIRAVERAVAAQEPLLVVTQRDGQDDAPTPEGLYEIGTEVTIERMLQMPDGSRSVLAQAHGRLCVEGWLTEDEPLRARVRRCERASRTTVPEAMRRMVLDLFEQCVELNENLPEDLFVGALNLTDPGALADLIASALEVETGTLQSLLEELDPKARLDRLAVVLAEELEMLELEEKIHAQVQAEVDASQREYYLREQLRVIHEELGENDPFSSEISELRGRIEALQVSEPVREKALYELSRLEAMPPGTPEVGIIRSYLDWILALPWAERSEDNLELDHAHAILTENHFGLPKIKDRILEYIAVRKLARDKSKTPILCFVGPPGTGKTSLGRSIAEALGRRFVRISLGGVHDEAEIRGHRRTYIGAMPGRILQGMRNAGQVNPVFMLDEIDKIGIDFRGDPSAALLEALDPEQNDEFSDHFLDLAFDLSQVLFICTANVLYTIPPALLDRMEIIEFSSYIEEEKLEIARSFLIPRQLENHGLEPDSLTFSEQAIRRLIREYTMEAGVRNLEREIANLCRKVARVVAEGRTTPKLISAASVERYLGPPQFTMGVAESEDEVGVATGVAVTEAGGDLLPIEVILMDGRGNLTLTGQLGDVMQESAQAALSFARANARRLMIEIEDFEKIDIHIHLPEGAIPKDGPSAGITMATALVSALSRRPVRRDVAMSGELTLRGRVLAVGGFKEKVLAAHRAGIKEFVAPLRNKKDLVDVPKRVRREVNFHFVEHMDEVFPLALLAATEKKPRRREQPRRRGTSSPPRSRRRPRPQQRPPVYRPKSG